MRIVWISHEAFLAGAQLSFLEAARGIVPRGHTIHAILPGREELAEPLERAGVTVSVQKYTWWVASGAWRAPKHRLRRLARNLIAATQFARFFREWRPDVVVSNTLAFPSGAFGAKLARVPHAWYVHELFGREGHDLYFDLGVPLSLLLMDRLSARIVANSCAVRDQFLRQIPVSKIRVVYYAVEVPGTALGSGLWALGSEPEPPGEPEGPSVRGWTWSGPRAQSPEPRAARSELRLIMVARMVPGKRQEDAVRALGLLAQKGVNARLELVGTEVPEYGRFLRGLARECGVLDRVDFVPFTHDPHGRVAAADLALMCSRGEGFGRVTVEAMKVGRPVVGADSGGTAELIRDGWNGLLYRLGDATDLAAKIETLGRDRTLLHTLGRNAQEWSRETFNLDRYTTGLLEAFAECVS